MKRLNDVVVLGAGIIGCAVAHELARRGARVCVIDSRDVGCGATQASAGVLAPGIESNYPILLAQLGVRSLRLYNEFIARVVEESRTEVQYVRNGALEVAVDEQSTSGLETVSARLTDLGISTEQLSGHATREIEPELTGCVSGGLLVPEYGFVAAADLAQAVRRAAVSHGASFISLRTATRILFEHGSIRIETKTDTMTAGIAVIAAGSWSSQIDVIGVPRLPVRPVRGQLLHLEWPVSQLQRILWSSNCYLVPWTDGSLLVGATVENVGFDERSTVAGVSELLEAVRNLVPRVRDAGFKTVRVGLRPGTPDDLPIVGASAIVPNLMYATGHYRTGVLLAPLTAVLVANFLLDGNLDPVLDSTSPSRFGAY